MLQRLGVYDEIVRSGATPIDRVRITSSRSGEWLCDLPGTALGVSRHLLDRLLFERAIGCGVDARQGVNVLSISGSLGEGFAVETPEGVFRSRMVIGAYGKKSALDGRLGRRPERWRMGYVAVKAHYAGDGPGRAVEVHTFDGGYCGVNCVEAGVVNVCWLARRSVLNDHGGRHEAVMSGAMATNPHLNERLHSLELVPGTLCATGNATLSHKGRIANDVILIGDTTQMIAPFCGDGMGMALRTGEIIAPLCAEFLIGAISRKLLIQNYTRLWKRNFGLRLVLGKVLQSIALNPISAESALALLSISPGVGRWMVEKTRGTPDVFQATSNKQPSMVSPGPKASATP